MKKNFKTIDFLGIKLKGNNSAFRPTLITEACARNINFKNKKILDLGCGIGPLAIYFSLNGASKVSASDIYEHHIELAKLNDEAYQTKIELINSDLFSKINDKYDVICCDVSGVNKNVAEITGWFPGKVPTADETGANLIIEVIKNSSNYLFEKGNLYICVTSFSEVKKIEETMYKYYRNSWKKIYSEEVPFSKRLKQNLNSIDSSNFIRKENDDYFWEFYIYKMQKKN